MPRHYDVEITDDRDHPSDPLARVHAVRVEDDELYAVLDAQGYVWEAARGCYVDEDGWQLGIATLYEVAERVAAEGGGRRLRREVW